MQLQARQMLNARFQENSRKFNICVFCIIMH